MYAQLASLKNSTASVEQQYQLGVEEEARQNAVKTPPSAPIINPNPPAPVAGAVDGAIAYAEAQLGEPYAFGGAGPNSWDCSGLTMMSYRSVGVYIGAHGVTMQYNTMKAEGRLVNLSQLQPGDLLFYARRRRLLSRDHGGRRRQDDRGAASRRAGADRVDPVRRPGSVCGAADGLSLRPVALTSRRRARSLP